MFSMVECGLAGLGLSVGECAVLCCWKDCLLSRYVCVPRCINGYW